MPAILCAHARLHLESAEASCAHRGALLVVSRPRAQLSGSSFSLARSSAYEHPHAATINTP